MKGVQYVFDQHGDVQAVIIDVKKHGKLWEDIQDILVARQRKKKENDSAGTGQKEPATEGADCLTML